MSQNMATHDRVSPSTESNVVHSNFDGQFELGVRIATRIFDSPKDLSQVKFFAAKEADQDYNFWAQVPVVDSYQE